MRRAYLSLGSNLGDRAGHLALGVAVVLDGGEGRVSDVYETAPLGGVDQGDFYNLVLEVTTEESARALLARARLAEDRAERVRTVPNGPRTLDVDILLVGDESVSEADLVVPHPRMWERRFVLAPLAELRPDLVPAALLEGASGDVRRIGTLRSLR